MDHKFIPLFSDGTKFIPGSLSSTGFGTALNVIPIIGNPGVNDTNTTFHTDDADAIAAGLGNTNGLDVSAFPFGWNGATWDRLRSASAANQSLFASIIGSLIVSKEGNWSQEHSPAGNVQATTTKAAGGVGVRHICTSISAFLNSGGAFGKFVLRDGASGVGAVLWSGFLQGAAGNLSSTFTLSNLSIVGSVNTAMTLEFIAAGGVGTTQSVAITGYSVG